MRGRSDLAEVLAFPRVRRYRACIALGSYFMRTPLRALRQSVVCLALLPGVISLPFRCVIAQAPAAVAQAAPKALFIDIIEGEGELNDVRARTAREPIVQVNDENHKPVAGALVLFSIETNSKAPLANFSGARSLSVRTGSDGRATANGYQVTGLAGQVRIIVHAVVGGAAADAVIHQTNFAKGSRLSRGVTHHKLLLGTGAVLGAAVAIIVLETKGSGTTITAGTGTVRP